MNNLYTSYYCFLVILIFGKSFAFSLFFIEEMSTASDELLTILPKRFPLDISFICYLLVLIVVLLWINSF